MSGGTLVGLTEGPLAFIGDVHGEIGAVESLLARVGERRGPFLVFLGDRSDRDPDSPEW